MYPYIYIFDRSLSIRDIMIQAGSLTGILVVGILLYRRFVKGSSGAGAWVRYMLVPMGLEVLLVFTAGSLCGRVIRGLSGSLTGSLSERAEYIAGNGGTHFIGTVIATGIFIPVFLWKLYREEEKSYIENAIAFFLVIQHIFNKFGCFFRGCCYGIPMSGPLSVRFPDSVLTYRVFPAQLFEAALMAVLLLGQILRYRRGKPVFAFTLSGFGACIFLAEFFTDKRGTILYLNLSAIQYFALLLTVIPVIVQRVRRHGK